MTLMTSFSQIAVTLFALAGPPDVYHAPDRPLDDRIDPAKVTEQEPPPLPEQIILPVPPEFRVATDPGRVPIDPAQFDRVHAAVVSGLRYLVSKQGAGGGWLAGLRAAPTDQPDTPAPVAVAVTALAVKAFAQKDAAILGDARFRAALRLLFSARRDDGSFEGGALTNYVTASVVMALATIDDADYLDELAGAGDWLQPHPWDQGAGMLLVEEAGGIVTDRSGKRAGLYSDGVVASNRALNAEFLRKTEGMDWRIPTERAV